jgi:hypothetical protein
MALCKPAAALAPITQQGVSLADSSIAFWETFGSAMGPSKREAIQAIGEELRDEWGCITVGCMAETMYVHDLEGVIDRAKGNRKWIPAIEHLLGSKFKRLSTAPESAALAREPLSSIGLKNIEACTQSRRASYPPTDPEERLGVQLLRAGKLENVCLDKAAILKLCHESQDLSRRLTFNDSCRVSAYLWSTTADSYQNYGNCKKLFQRIHEEMVRIGVPYPNKGDWPGVCANHWETRRKRRAAVRAAL